MQEALGPSAVVLRYGPSKHLQVTLPLRISAGEIQQRAERRAFRDKGTPLGTQPRSAKIVRGFWQAIATDMGVRGTEVKKPIVADALRDFCRRKARGLLRTSIASDVCPSRRNPSMGRQAGGDAGQAVRPAIEVIRDFGAESDGGGRTLLAQSRCQRRYASMVFGFISE